MKPTHVFTLTSGVECEVGELTGKEQYLLTVQDGKPHTEKLNEMLASVVVRVGTITDITPEFIGTMLSGDRKLALVETRQFTLDFQKTFDMTHKYLKDNGEKAEGEVSVPIPEGFPVKKMMVSDDLGETWREADFKDYGEVSFKKQKVKLPKSGMVIEFEHLTAKGEKWVQQLSKKSRSSHTMIEMRFPVYFEKTDKTEVPIKLRLNELHQKDIEALRSFIKKAEGDVGTEVMFEHPEADKMAPNEKTVTIDALGTVAFFFPSEAI